MIFTIGHSNRTVVSLLHDLKSRGITKLIDVRSNPFTRVPGFSAPQIERWAPAVDLFYAQAGSVLGGRVSFGTRDPRFLAALKGLAEASTQERVAIMCAEGDPTVCHRSLKVGATLLAEFGVEVRDILRDGTDRDIADTLKSAGIAGKPAEPKRLL